MKSWKLILFDSCDACAGDVEVLSSAEEGFFNDGDLIRCKSCGSNGNMKINNSKSCNYTIKWIDDLTIDSAVIVEALKENTKEVCSVKWCRSMLKPVVFVYQEVYGKQCKVGICTRCNKKLKLKEGDTAPDYDTAKKALGV